MLFSVSFYVYALVWLCVCVSVGLCACLCLCYMCVCCDLLWLPGRLCVVVSFIVLPCRPEIIVIVSVCLVMLWWGTRVGCVSNRVSEMRRFEVAQKCRNVSIVADIWRCRSFLGHFVSFWADCQAVYVRFGSIWADAFPSRHFHCSLSPCLQN